MENLWHTTRVVQRAFNPSCLLLRQNTIARLMIPGGHNPDSLTQEERLAEDSSYRHLLRMNLPDLNFRVLWLHYTDDQSIESAGVVFNGLREWVRKAAGINRSVDPAFLMLATLGSCWKTNLFNNNHSIARFGSVFTHCRRKKRIANVMEAARIESMNLVERVLKSAEEKQQA